VYSGKLKFKKESNCDVVCRRKINDHLKGDDKAQSYSQKLPVHQLVFSIFIPKCFISDTRKVVTKKKTTREENQTVLTASILQFTALISNFPLCATWYNSQDTAEKHQNIANMHLKKIPQTTHPENRKNIFMLIYSLISDFLQDQECYLHVV